MAIVNSLSSNITNKIARVFLPQFEKMRVISKTVNTKLLTPNFTPQFGDEIAFKRPHQYLAIETDTGDISQSTFNNILSGKAIAKVQPYITVPIEWSNREEALDLDQLEDIIRPAAEECVTRFETNFAEFMILNSGLSAGTVGDPLTTWGDVANFGALMSSIGVRTSGDRYCVMNPFQMTNLADTQTGLASGNNSLVNTAWEDAQISTKFAGLRTLMSNSMSTYTHGVVNSADLAGVKVFLSNAADTTYVGVKDTMTQLLTVVTANAATVLEKGDIIELNDVKRTNVKTRKIAFDADGAGIPWRYTVVAKVGGSGTSLTYTVAAAAIFETGTTDQGIGQYNNCSEAVPLSQPGSVNAVILSPAAGDSTILAPNLFYHKEAAGIGTIRLPKLHTWDTIAETSDGISIRVTKYSDGSANTQQIRFDLLPAHSMFNPLWCGTGWGA